MKKNEIKFVSTEAGINCEGICVLSKEDRNKCKKMLQQVKNAAKDYGASLSITPTGIQLGFNVACSCGMDTIHEAAAHMGCIIEQIRDFISKLEYEKHEEIPEDKVIAEQQNEAINKFFEEMRKKYPNAKLAIICDDSDWVSVATNMSPMHMLHRMIEAISSKKHEENQ